MKIAITAQGQDLTSELDGRFGRCAYFVVCDTESGDVVAIDNAQNFNAAQGAGIQAARHVADAGAEAVISTSVGPKAYATLTGAGIAVYSASGGTVGAALEAFKVGELTRMDSSNVESHWI